MPLDFPSNPSLNDVYSFNNKTWIYNGVAWQIQSSGAINATPIGNISPSTGAFTTLSATGNITSSGNISGNYITGVLTTASQPNITELGKLTTLGVTGNITSSGNVSATYLIGTISTASQPYITTVGQLSSLGVTGNIIAGNLSSTAGVFATASVSGNVNVGSNINNTGGNGTGNIGSSTTYFNTVFAKATSAQYADLAEKYTADAFYESGTVVVFGGQAEITVSTAYAQMNIAGVISTDPAYIMNAGAAGFPVALQGRVPCRVTGTIRKGDLVTSSEIEGVATRLDPTDWVPGSVIGKALENYDSDEVGVIEVVVGRV